LYQGVKVYEKELLRQYDNNKQWVLNGIGRPLGIYEPYKRDIVNRVVQSTGHDVHLFYILITADLLNQAGINWRPIIIDFHDQMIVEVAEKDAPRVKEIMGQEAYSRLNALLNGRLKLKGDAQIVKNMAEAKCAKEDIEQYLKDLGVLGDGGDE
jgi:DNA polymerase I-like protein with 3'-5' exonuclease and polymerase domains